MTNQTNYDLTLILEADLAEDRQQQILELVSKVIDEGGGAVTLSNDWGRRKLAYKINHQPEAHYHFIQLSATTETLDKLRASLAVSEGIVRFRLIKQAEDAAQIDENGPPPVPEGGTPSRRDEGDDYSSRRSSY